MLSGQTATTSETAVITSETPVDAGEIPLVHAANVVIGDTPPTVMHLSSCKLLSGSVCSINTGRTCALAAKEMELLRWIFECRKQGIQVMTRAVQKVADKIVPLKSNLTNNLILFDNELQSYLFQFGFSLRSKIIFSLLLSGQQSQQRQ